MHRHLPMSPQQLETDQPHFVWTVGLRGPEPQKWGALDYGVGGWKKNSVLAVYPLTKSEAALPLDILAKIYPSPTSHADQRDAA